MKMRFGLGVLAYLRTRLFLTPHAVPRLLQTPCDLPQAHHHNHTLRLSLDADPGICLCLGLPVGLRAAHESLLTRGLRYAAFGALLSWSFTALAVASQERDDIRPGLSRYRDRIHGREWIMVEPLTALAFARAPQKVTAIP